MIIKKPDSSLWLFDTVIKIEKNEIKKREKPDYHNKITINNLSITHIKFKYLNEKTKYNIISILLPIFGRKLDIKLDTYIHYITIKNTNTIISIACSDTDENIEKLYRSNGWKLKDTIGIKANGIYLYNLLVCKTYQSKGYGKLLCNNIILFYSNLNFKSLHVQIKDTNKLSLNLFEKLQFLKETTLKISNSENIIHYTRWL